MKGTGEYTADWPDIARQRKEEADWECVRCGHPHDPGNNYVLTVHHLDGDKSNNAEWNTPALCQRCHLAVQGKVFLPQFYMFEHSDWFKPFVEGYYQSLLKQYDEFPGLRAFIEASGLLRFVEVTKIASGQNGIEYRA